MKPPTSGPASPGWAARTWRGVWTLAKPSLWVLLTAVLVLGAWAAGLNWLLRHESGTAWLLARIPGVQVEGLQGALLGERWQIRRLRVEVGGSVRAVIIDDVDAQGVQWQWRTDAPRWLTLQAARLTARQVTVETGTSKADKPAQLPTSLQLPLAIEVGHVAVPTVVIGSLAQFTGVQARVAMDAGELGHRVDELQFEWDRIRARANGRIASTRPFDINLRGWVRPQQGDDWNAELQAQGPLARVALQASLRAPGLVGRDAPSLDASANVAPFEPWALASLSARMQALDLATLASGLPRTRLAGRAEVQSRAIDAPFGADIQLDNAAAGRWDEERLPIKRLALTLKATLAQRDQLELSTFDMLFGNAQAEAGHWSGRGRWAGDELHLDSQLRELRPQSLDARAPRATLSGPLTLVLNGQRIPGSPPAAPTGKAGGGQGAPLALSAKSTLEGRVEGAALPLQLQLELHASAQQIELRQLRASAGQALAQAKASAQPRPAAQGGGWQLKSEGVLAEFDPRQWWPGAEGSAWRTGPHRFNGEWSFDVLAPPLPGTTPASKGAGGWLPWLQRLAGNGSVRLRDSALAGVPLSTELSLTHNPRAGTAHPAQLNAALQLGGNLLSLQGQGNPAGDGSEDHWVAELKAPHVATLAPLARLSADWAPWAPRDGSAELSMKGDGRWPALRSAGHFKLERMRLGELMLDQAQAQWRLDTARDQPLDTQLELRGLRQGRQSLDHARLALQGTLREHQVQIDTALPLRPPAWFESLLGSAGAPAGTRARLTGEGQWLGDGSGGGRWRGRIANLRAMYWDPRRSAPPSSQQASPDSGATWLDASDLRAELRFSAEGGLTEFRAEPARVRLAEAITLRWDAVAVDMRPATPDFSLSAEIEPFAAAPLLARLQPTVGWGGDLQLAARLDLKAASRFDADVVFERRGGDLFVEDALGRQSLGLSALKLSLAAHDGVWRFTPQASGRSLGEISGGVQTRIRPEQRWPDAKAPLEGAIEARVNNLGIWSTWVPPGWRLVGSLATSASLGGTLGAPEYTGSMAGSNIGVRNLLQGVDVAGGELLISLKGDRAAIERFTMRGGDGQLTLSGGAEFGASPVARVQVRAERFRVLGRVDRSLSLSGQAGLELRADRLRLDGQVRVDEGVFDVSRRDAPSLDEDVTVRGAASTTTQASDATTGAEPARPLRRNSQVALQVDLGEKLRVRGRGLDTLLSGQLRFSTPDGRPHLTGIVRAVDGTYVGYGQKLEIDRGLLSFSGPPENPNLDILALRQNLDVRVGVAIVGSLVNPRVRLYSDPDMGDTDKLSWLVLGRPSDGLGRADSALLQRAAVALLAGEGEAPTDALLRRIGLDELSLRQGDGEVRETVITLGKQLSRRWYLGYERGVNATSGTWQLIYRVAQRFTVRAQSGHENSLDVIWVWRRGEYAAQQPAASPVAAPAAATASPATPVTAPSSSPAPGR